MLLKTFNRDADRELPSILIMAGVHGSEVGAMILLNCIKERFEQSDLKINTSFINYANPTAIEHSQRKSVCTDMSDMNRGWQGGNDRMEIAELVKSHDVLLDLHTSRCCTEFLLFNNGQNINYKWLEKECLPFGIREGENDTLKMLANRECQLGMTWEMSGLDFPDNDAISRSIDVIMDKILGNWKEFCKNAYDDSQAIKNLMPEQLMQAVVPRSKGLIHWRLDNLSLGQKVEHGGEIGKILSIYDGSVVEKLHSPCKGTVIYLNASFATPYSPVCFIQPDI